MVITSMVSRGFKTDHSTPKTERLYFAKKSRRTS